MTISEYFVEKTLMNISTKQTECRNSVDKDICDLLSAILNTEKFEIAPHLISYAGAQCSKSAMTNQLWAEHMTSQVGGASGTFDC